MTATIKSYFACANSSRGFYNFFESNLQNLERLYILKGGPGTGKSTQAELWKEYRNARIINGDRAAIRISDSSVHAAGLPFAGSSSYCENRTLPLCAIVYLEQAPETSIVPFGGKLAFQKLLEGCTINSWNKSDVIKIMDLVQKCMSQVPVYKLSCRPDFSAVQALEEELCKRD